MPHPLAYFLFHLVWFPSPPSQGLLHSQEILVPPLPQYFHHYYYHFLYFVVVDCHSLKFKVIKQAMNKCWVNSWVTKQLTSPCPWDVKLGVSYLDTAYTADSRPKFSCKIVRYL